MSTSSSSSVLLLIFWAASTTTLTTTTILQIAEATNINDQPTVHCSQNSVCPNTYPICCSGFCVSAGSYCCGSNNCDPGQQCCRDGCCPPGSSCTEHGCYPDAPCSTYTDPGLCLSPFKPEVSPNNATTTTPTSGCVWSCTDRRCMSSADAISRGSMTSSYPTITTLEDQCPEICNTAFTCKQCLNGSHTVKGYDVPCYWCASNQRCTFDSSSCSSYMKVFTDDHCSDVLFRGAGVFPVASEDNQQLANWLNGGTFLSLSVFIFGIVIMTVMLFMVVKMALQQRRTPEGVARQRDQQEEHITRAVPRFGFEDDDENNSDSDDDSSNKKKSEDKRSLIKGNKKNKNKSRATVTAAAVSGLSDKSMEGREGGQQQREDETDEDNNTITTSQRCCSVCKVATGGESKRNFIVASEKEQEKVASWSYVVALPCNHKLCKKCLIDTQTAKATKSNPRRILQKAGGVFSRIRAATVTAADISENAATVEAPPAVVPLGDEDVSSAAVLAALGDNHACLCCTSMVKCVFIPSKMLK